MKFRRLLSNKSCSKKNEFLVDSVADATRTTLEVLRESADAFPPLQSTVGSVIAIWDIQRVRGCQLLICHMLLT